MSNLSELVRQFKPQRVFRCSHTTVEVDSVFVRVAHETEKNSWIPVAGDDGVTHYSIDVEDIVTDPSVIRGARVSTDRDTNAVNEKAQGLMTFLWRDAHVTPFEGIMLRLRFETPILFAQPFFRLFATHNEFSGRYSVIDGEYYTPSDINTIAELEFRESACDASETYHYMLDMGVATEMARLALPYRFVTKFYMTISLRHLLEFLCLSNVPDRHTTTEFWKIRDVLQDIVKHWTPWAFQAWQANPHLVDFGWVSEVSAGALPINLYTPKASTDVLDQGYVDLLNVFGSDDLMRSTLDDFPDPRRAFGHAGMQFRLLIPIHVFRQWVRHRYGHWSEPTIGFDQVVTERKFFVPARFRRQEGKVGAYTFSDMSDDDNTKAQAVLRSHIDRSCRRYLRLCGIGASEEVAGMVLPYTFYIPVVWTVSVESLLNFFSLRCDGHAQYEIRQYANAVWDMFAQEFPHTARLFAQHLHRGDSARIKAFA